MRSASVNLVHVLELQLLLKLAGVLHLLQPDVMQWHLASVTIFSYHLKRLYFSVSLVHRLATRTHLRSQRTSALYKKLLKITCYSAPWAAIVLIKLLFCSVQPFTSSYSATRLVHRYRSSNCPDCCLLIFMPFVTLWLHDFPRFPFPSSGIHVISCCSVVLHAAHVLQGMYR